MFRRYPLPAGLSNSDVFRRGVCPYGASCNQGPPTGEVVIPAFAMVSRTGPIDAGAGAPQNTYLLTGRIDYRLDSKTTLTGRYAYQDVDRLAVVSQPYSPELDRSTNLRESEQSPSFCRIQSGRTS